MKIKEINPERANAKKRLESFLRNPGNFSILVIGKAGTGKSYFIDQVANQFKQQNKIFKKVIHCNSGLCEASKGFWDDLLRKANNKILVIDEVDRLSYPNQDWLFEAISTTNGLYGFDKKAINCKLLFTSCLPIDRLRNDRRYLQSRFFDRISQFVVKLPNFSTTAKYIDKDFIKTWTKMNFKEHFHVPEMTKELKNWLIEFARRSHGNFRDLDKIVINWHNYKLMGFEDNDILEMVKKDFKEFLYSPELKLDQDNVFIFQRDIKMKEILADFRSCIKRWAELEYENKYEAARALGISVRSLERYV